MPQDCANRLFEKIIKQYFILDEDYVNPIDYDSGYCEVISCNSDIGQIKKGTKISRICFFDETLYVWLNFPVKESCASVMNEVNEAKLNFPVKESCASVMNEVNEAKLNEPEEDLYRIDNADVVLKVNILCTVSKC